MPTYGTTLVPSQSGSSLYVIHKFQQSTDTDACEAQVHGQVGSDPIHVFLVTGDLALETLSGYASNRGKKPLIRTPKVIIPVRAGSSSTQNCVVVQRTATFDLILFVSDDSSARVDASVTSGGTTTTYVLEPGQQLRVYASSVAGPSAILGDASLKTLFKTTKDDYDTMTTAEPTRGWYDPMELIREDYDNSVPTS